MCVHTLSNSGTSVIKQTSLGPLLRSYYDPQFGVPYLETSHWVQTESAMRHKVHSETPNQGQHRYLGHHTVTERTNQDQQCYLGHHTVTETPNQGQQCYLGSRKQDDSRGFYH
ncbi:hypothetical protein M8J77_021150 [Diaphorina citri]|nr:hypothetical protein M8J77_021150 [Diaphorina citri]